MQRVSLPLLLALLAGCATTAPDAKTIDQLLDLDKQFDADTSERGVDAWVSYFAPNGVMLHGESPADVGHNAIRTTMAPFFDAISLRWQPTEGGVWANGELGYTTGRFASRRTNGDGELEVKNGTYITIWKRMKDGNWKVVFDSGVMDRPEEKSEGEPPPTELPAQPQPAGGEDEPTPIEPPAPREPAEDEPPMESTNAPRI